VFCGSNNAAGRLRRYPPTIDLGCLLCFRASDGQFLWQFSCQKLAAGRTMDWPQTGLCSSPLVEGKRLWIVTNRCEVVCLGTEPGGASGGAGPSARAGASTGETPVPPAGGDQPSGHEPQILWRYDMIRQLGVSPHNMSSCSVTAFDDLLLVCTGNGVDESHEKIPAPDAPSFIALDKNTGRLLWTDRSPGRNILHGQWSSPAVAVAGGVPQAVFAGGDGWLYGFRLGDEQGAESGEQGAGSGSKPKAHSSKLKAQSSKLKAPLLWKFDCNPKTALWKEGGLGDRATLVATPVLAGGRVYIAMGDDPEFGEGPGRLWCLQTARRGDVSAELVVDRQGRPVPPRRVQAADPTAGEVVRANPNSAVVWQYTGREGKAQRKFEDTMHRALGMAVVQDGLLVIGDLAGLIHCLDAATGRVHWTYDLKSAVWGSPLVADGKVYLADEDGDVVVLALSPQFKLLAKNSLGAAIYTTPVAAHGTLYLATRTHLIAIARGKPQN
jgi:outer membrane protein assembly factor BamB